jgi:tRNA (guanosine-2'-O-)-methyltransferase
MMDTEQQLLLTDHLGQYISDHKKAFIERVLHQRTRHITVVMENIYQSQNASAVVRTCECLGVQDIHFVENTAAYSINPKVLKGSNKWLDLIRYRTAGINNTASCFEELRQKGYTILVTDPSPECMSVENVPVDRKLAIVMGNELRGVSPWAMEHADLRASIPMYGFTESFNISVSAAICLHTLLPKLRASKVAWQLSEEEKKALRLQWYRGVVKRSSIIAREFIAGRTRQK